jgi:hypothetical protein
MLGWLSAGFWKILAGSTLTIFGKALIDTGQIHAFNFFASLE